MTPRHRIEAEAQRSGRQAVASNCAALLRGEEIDSALVHVLGGPGAAWGLERQDHWLRVWAARGLLWCWVPLALPELLQALDDEAWRVREMACKVVARHCLDEALPQVLSRQDDPVARVRTAAARAVRSLTAA